MANEAVIIELLGNGGDVVEFTVANGATIEKGTICKLGSTPRTAAASGAADVFAGIAATEKVINDGSTKLGLYTHGVFDLVATGAITLGAMVSLSGANLVKAAVEADFPAGKVIGKCLETAANAETVAVLVGAR